MDFHVPANISRQQAREEAIFQKETEYLESTPSGNIITGFDNYTKGTSSAAAQRRKTGLTEANRVFSRSSISYNPNAVSPRRRRRSELYFLLRLLELSLLAEGTDNCRC